jgi:hypothetical protein
MKIEKNYLTTSEIRYIGQMLIDLEDSDFMTREYIKYLTIADFCTDFKLDTDKDENGNDTVTWKEEKYNELWANGDIEVLDKEIKNIYLIDMYVDDKQSTYNLFKELGNQLTESVKNFNIDETKEVMKQFSDLVDKEKK